MHLTGRAAIHLIGALAARERDDILFFQNPEAESDFKKEARRHWARLIKRVYEVDPLVGPQCCGRMRIIRFIEDAAVIERLLRHLGLWQAPVRAPGAPPSATSEITLDYPPRRIADEPASYDEPPSVLPRRARPLGAAVGADPARLPQDPRWASNIVKISGARVFFWLGVPECDRLLPGGKIGFPIYY